MIKDFSTVAHLYLGCEVIFDRKQWLFWKCSGRYMFLKAKNNKQNMCHFHEAKPVLRKLESMSLEEWDSIKNMFSIDVYNAVYSGRIGYFDKPPHVLVLENRLQTNTLTFNDGLVLLSKHFDLFSLIDNNLAIDKSK